MTYFTEEWHSLPCSTHPSQADNIGPRRSPQTSHQSLGYQKPWHPLKNAQTLPNFPPAQSCQAWMCPEWRVSQPAESSMRPQQAHAPVPMTCCFLKAYGSQCVSTSAGAAQDTMQALSNTALASPPSFCTKACALQTHKPCDTQAKPGSRCPPCSAPFALERQLDGRGLCPRVGRLLVLVHLCRRRRQAQRQQQLQDREAAPAHICARVCNGR